ncbi:MAG: GAF domain-containing sensor histidine kinase [Candidatus Omnitrophica bacterium]|nr:GAF domain-containing sensor histidine kinase [Candidatus Omnitrophota bacterium]
MIKFHLMDITIVLTRTSIFIAVYSLVLGIPFIVGYRLLGGGTWLLPVSLMAVFATIGPFIYLFIQKKAEDKLLQEQRQYQSTLRHASLGMGRIKDLKRLLNLIVRIVTRAVKIEHCEIYLYHEPSQQFILKASKGKLKNVKERMSAISGNAMLTKIFHSLREPLVADEIYQRTNDPNADPLCMTLKRLEAALVVPSYIEKRLIAIFVLGRKISGAIYSQDDLAVFSILANQSGLAIENAQYYEDTKRTQAQLLRAEKMATIGTMADGLSHQINNRLHAMGFIAGDALDTIRMAKKNKNGAKPKDLIKDVQFALERIQENVKRGGEIVEGLLKYTRKGSEGLGPVDLNKLVDAAMEMAQFKMRKGEIEIIKQYAKSVPKIKGNFTQLQEVFFNIIDNSYDAMMQRKEELKEKDFKGIITIDAKQRLKDIEITLEDNGIGVKKENKNKLFTPFFTTKLSSKKGTGLGLYVIRQIIEDNHSGEVQFNSTYRKGSRTTITLPTV